MQVVLTSTKITITMNGLSLVLQGMDMIQAKIIDLKDPAVNTAPIKNVIRLFLTGTAREALGEFYDIDLSPGMIDNQPTWTTGKQAGANTALAAITPIVRAMPAGGGGGQVDSVVGGAANSVDATDPVNPIVNVQVDGVTIGINGSNQLEVPAGGGGYVPVARLINTTAPIAGGGDLSANRTISLNDDGVTNAKLANMAEERFKGRDVGAGTGDPQDLTPDEASDILDQAADPFPRTSALGTAAYEDVALVSAANAVVQVDGSGKIDISFIPDSVLGQLEYQGTWNGATNTPAIPAASTANKGWYYVTSVAVAAGHGWPNIPNVAYDVGDWLVCNGTTWDKIDNTDAVSSVFGRLGAILAANGDYTASQVTNVPAGSIAAITVQAALNELDAEKIADPGGANDDVLQRKAGAWTFRTLAQYLADQATGILNLVLTGLSVATATVVTAADTILVAIGKLQAQFDQQAATFLVYSGGSVANSTTTLAAVHASADFTVATTGFYHYQWKVTFDAAATTTGMRLSFTAPANNYVNFVILADTLLTDRAAFAVSAAPASSRATSGNIATLDVWIRVTTTGTMTLQFSSEVGGSAVTITGVVGMGRRISS